MGRNDLLIRTFPSELLVMERGANKLKALTSEHYHGTESIIDGLEKTAPRDYNQFNAHQKDQLGALINHIHALSKLINKKIQ